VLINLPPQPFKILALLASHAGDLVTREQIQREIWGTETFVDFEKGLNFAIKKIREALGDDAGSPRYVETLPRRGYRFIAPVERVPDSRDSAHPVAPILRSGLAVVRGPELVEPQHSPARDPALQIVMRRTEAPPSPQLPGNPRHRWLLLAAGGAIVLAVSLIVAWTTITTSRRSPATLGKVVMFVRPLANMTSDPSQDYVSAGISEEISSQLTRLNPDHLTVIGRDTSTIIKDETIAQIQKDTHAQFVLQGSMQREGDKIRINAQLIRIEDRAQIWANIYDRDVHGILPLQAEIANAIAGEIQLKLTPAQQSNLSKSYHPKPEAHDAYLKGHSEWRKRTLESFQKAIEYFQQAIAIDGDYAAPHAGLADVYNLMGENGYSQADEAYLNAKAEVLKALELDPNSAEAYTTLADVKINYDRDWQGAADDFQRAILLNPNYENAHLWYGEDYLSRLGQHPQAIIEIKRAHEIDPLSPDIVSILSEVYYFARLYDDAISEAKRAIAMNPYSDLAIERLGWAYEQKGMYEEAIAAFKQMCKTCGNDSEKKAQLAHVYARSGDKAQARELLKTLRRKSRQQYVPPYFFAIIFTALRENKQALDWLEKAYEAHDLPPILVEPRFDNLRSEPRFQDLLRKIRLSAG
jgi:TolB-like protein/Tfp pilus assembly protein PilF